MNTNFRIFLSLGLLVGFVATLVAAIFTPGLGLQHAVVALGLLAVQGMVELGLVGWRRRVGGRTNLSTPTPAVFVPAFNPAARRSVSRRHDHTAAIAA